MKKIFSLVVLFASVLMANAQSSVIATLHHGGDIKTFYGMKALREAHAEATHGDVITLSSGTYTSCDITKAITLRGAGIVYDTISCTEPTILTGDFSISIPYDPIVQGNALTIEGIYHYNQIKLGTHLYNPQFIKCYLNEVNYNSNMSIINGTFIHCFFRTLNIVSGSANLFNCYVNNPMIYDNSSASFEFQNCVIESGSLYQLMRSTFRNCFIYGFMDNRNYPTGNNIGKTCAAYNCVGYRKSGSSNSGSMFGNIPNTTNIEISSISKVFKTWTGETLNATSLSTEKLELKDEAKTNYLGSDGTEIGIYGGPIPFVARLNNPQITKLKVASKSTADGKLSVDIEVKAAE